MDINFKTENVDLDDRQPGTSNKDNLTKSCGPHQFCKLFIKTEPPENTITTTEIKQESVNIKLEPETIDEYDVKEEIVVKYDSPENKPCNSTGEIYVFKCGLCQAQRLTQRLLLKHMQIDHGHKVLVCNICDYFCSSSYDLKSHTKGHFSNKCKLCNYRCRGRKALQKHMLIHLGRIT